MDSERKEIRSFICKTIFIGESGVFVVEPMLILLADKWHLKNISVANST